MFGSSKNYEAVVHFKRYQSFTKSEKTFRKFIKSIFHDPSDTIGINQVVLRLKDGSPRIRIRVKEKEVQKLQKMTDKGQLSLEFIQELPDR